MDTQFYGEFFEAMDSMTKKLAGWPEDYKRRKLEAIRSVTPEDFNQFSEYLAGMIKNGIKLSAGGQAVIEENKKLFDTVVNPF